MRDRHRHFRAVARAVSLAVLAGLMSTGLVVRADPTASTDDRSVTVATREWTYSGISAATVQSTLAMKHARLTRIVMDGIGPGRTFTVTMVLNAGAYKVAAWWWYTDISATQLDADLSANNGRLIFVDAYDSSTGELFAAVMVQNSGVDARSWWWVRDDTNGSAIASALTAHGARLTEVRSYVIGGNEHQVGIMVLQTGIDAKSWSWGLNFDVATIQSHIDSWHYRLISLERNPFGGFDYVLVQSEGEGWSWSTDQTLAQVNKALAQKHARLIDITPYPSGGSTLYALVMVDNSNAETVALNAESQRVGGILAKGLKQGVYGVFLKPIAGAATVGLNQTFRFEPASAIKVLYLLYAMRQVQAGADSLSSDFVYYPDPSNPSNPGVCPDPAWETPGNAAHTTLSQALAGMMQVSDNRYTRGMALRYGIANVQALAQTIGMSNTHLRQDRIGCLFVNGIRNELTEMDIGSLYEQVDSGGLLNPGNTSAFFGFMLGGVVPPGSALGSVVRQEAAKQGKSSAAAAFIAGMRYHEKPGNEFMCVSSNCSTSPQYLDFTSIAGVMTLPFKSGGSVTPHDYVYSRFGNDFVLPCVPGGGCSADKAEVAAISTLGSGGAETYRQQVAAALTTW